MKQTLFHSCPHHLALDTAFLCDKYAAFSTPAQDLRGAQFDAKQDFLDEGARHA